MPAADRQTKLGLRVNRPRVYVVTSLAGGSGSGMFLDVAYLARGVMLELGYQHPEVVGLFFLPPAEGNGAKLRRGGQQRLRRLDRAASLQRVGNTFTARYHTKQPALVDDDPPFVRCVFLSGETRSRPRRAGGHGRAASWPATW